MNEPWADKVEREMLSVEGNKLPGNKWRKLVSV